MVGFALWGYTQVCGDQTRRKPWVGSALALWAWGGAFEAAYLAREYGFTDADGTQPPFYRQGAYFQDDGFVCPRRE